MKWLSDPIAWIPGQVGTHTGNNGPGDKADWGSSPIQRFAGQE